MEKQKKNNNNNKGTQKRTWWTQLRDSTVIYIVVWFENVIYTEPPKSAKPVTAQGCHLLRVKLKWDQYTYSL